MSKNRNKRAAKAAKPTSMSIGFRLPKHSNATNASIRPDGTIVITDAEGNEVVPEYMEREVFYDRPGKPKVQTRWRLDAGVASVSGIPELARYESLFAIDTSTRTVDGQRVSVACFFSFRLVPNGNKFAVEPEAKLNFYEFRAVNDGNPEMLAILKVARDVAASAPVRPGVAHRFAFVTDSELGAHDDINSRARPIYGNHYLPEQFRLVYASAETGHEFVKKLVSFCDQQADIYFKQMAKGTITKPLETLSQDSAVRYRFLFRTGLEVVNPVVDGPSIAPGSTIEIYGQR